MWRIVSLGFFLLALAACSTTPGDAARWGGNYPQAAALYEVGAKQGDRLAARKLGELYDLRPGLPEDHQKAIYWYKRAIDLGDIPSYWFAGVIYRDGKGNIPRDYGLAEVYFLQAAEKGMHYALYDLAGMYAQKQTKVLDDIEGLKWLNVVTIFASSCSSAEGCQYILRDPKKIKDTLETRMTPDQRQKAKQLADSWIEDWKQKHKNES